MSNKIIKWALTALGAVIIIGAAIGVPSPTRAITWGAVRPITTSGEGMAWASSTVAYGGGIALAYREIVDGEYGVYVRRSPDGGTSWETPTKLSLSGTLASRPAMAAGGNTLDAVFAQSNDGGTTSRLVYRTSVNGGGTWSSPLAVSPTGTVAGFPSVSRSGSTVVVAWTDNLTGKVNVRISRDGGATFRSKIIVATSSSQPFLGIPDYSIDAFPAVAISNGVINVAYYTSQGSLRLRRTSTYGNSWSSAKTLASNGNGLYKPTLATAGKKILVAYGVWTGTRAYTASRRSGDSGANWSTATALSGGSATPSYGPIITYRASRWRVAFERCPDPGCSESDVYYRTSVDGTTWGATSRVTNGPNLYQWPAGVTHDEGKVVVAFISTDGDGAPIDVLTRQTK